jgi:sentrin-specific protease 1
MVYFNYLLISRFQSLLSFKQENGNDCGVFTCAIGDCIARSVPFNFKQADMPYFRKRLVVEIVTTTFLS